MLRVFAPFHLEKFTCGPAQIIQFAGQCLLVAPRILSRFFPDTVRGRNVLRQFDLAEGCTTCPFHLLSPCLSIVSPLPHITLPFPLCLYFVGAAVICCDKAASTGDARVSRVEGHAPPLSQGRSSLSSGAPSVPSRSGKVMIYL